MAGESEDRLSLSRAGAGAPDSDSEDTGCRRGDAYDPADPDGPCGPGPVSEPQAEWDGLASARASDSDWPVTQSACGLSIMWKFLKAAAAPTRRDGRGDSES